MQLEKVIYEKRGPLVIATINNEEQLNGLSPGVRRDMNKAWDTFEADPEARIMIITGKGRAFCARFCCLAPPSDYRPRPVKGAYHDL